MRHHDEPGAGAQAGGEPGADPGPLRPVRRLTSVAAVVDRLITAIAVRDFTPGERLPPQRELAVLLGVSRPTLRAALDELAASGHVETRRGRAGGTWVRAGDGERTSAAVARTLLPTWAQLEESFDLRRLVEATIARTAAERHDAADDVRLRERLAAYEAAGGEEEASRSTDADLHRAVCAAAHNSQLQELSRQLLARVNLGMPREPFTRADYDRALPQHRALVAAVLASDAERAAAVAHEHFAITEDRVRAALGGS
ncbi:FCD domain-containing protein [Kineococcus sp. R8]|uniref:FadR/GntR family transcriptional regulator n=1 Tax=Kineococcus siccus TaxID=2696567 RepID=UPI00141259D8|nr:FCD domain-containing protein [Kineococcus siccus]NAZ82654.1 FCD domain-containing protein [Kineococcus siccus]